MALFSKAEKLELERVLNYEVAINSPLYFPISFDVEFENSRNIARAFIHSSFKADLYCPQCEKESHFDSDGSIRIKFDEVELGFFINAISGTSTSTSIQSFQFNNFFQRTLTCARSKSHILRFYFYTNGLSVVKIGQHPSLEDIIGTDILKYKNVLNKADFIEIRKATGLASHGVNIGAYIYLRRVFERIIGRAVDNSGIDGLQDARMEDKIKSLSAHLPAFLVNNRRVYSFLSEGVHQLSEDECAKNFAVLRASILLMAEQAKELHDKKSLEADLEKSIGLLSTKSAKSKK